MATSATQELFYLIECLEDRSYCIIPESDILYDEEIEINMEVQFFYNKKSFSGKVIRFSSNDEELKLEAKELKRKEMKDSRPSKEKNNKRSYRSSSAKFENSRNKRDKSNDNNSETRKHKKICSSTNEEGVDQTNNTGVKDDVTLMKNVVENDTISVESVGQKDTLSITESAKENNGDGFEKPDDPYKNDNKSLDENEFLETETDASGQMYGPNCGKEMVQLIEGSNVYCIKRVLLIAKSTASQPTHFIRRLTHGVFDPAKLQNVTLTGRPPHSQGEERAKHEYECLDVNGKDAITKFMRMECQRRKWNIPTEKEIKHNFTQIIGEIKRDWIKQNSKSTT